ncbi:MAG: beta-lactamase family protein, partial [Candidatus Riflebacteria bacterium]|nr:beta-lactamase family protein [Candidatus Riflebacteria bacterium]
MATTSKLPLAVGLVWLCIAATAAHAQSPAPGGLRFPEQLREQVDLLVDPFLETGRGVGMVVGVVKGDRTWVFGYGSVARGSARTPDGNTVFEIGSATKTFSGILTAALIQEGRMDLTQPIERYLPPGVKVPSRDGRKITVTDLVTHSSGLPYHATNGDEKNPHGRFAGYTPEQLYRFLGSFKLDRSPGTRYDYSNVGAGLVSHAAALVTHKTFEAMVKERITGPLGMNDTAIALAPELQARKAQGYDADLNPVLGEEIGTLEGAGALRSTANDMLTYLKANLGLVKTPCGPAMALSHNPLFTVNDFLRVGIFWHVLKDGAVFHSGATTGFHSFQGFSPADKAGVVVLSNCMNAPAAELIGLYTLGFACGRPCPPVKLDMPVTLAPAALDSCVGEFRTGSGDLFVVSREGSRLVISKAGCKAVVLYPKSPTEFDQRAATGTIAFHRDAQGKATGLTIQDNGKSVTAERLPGRSPPPAPTATVEGGQ